MTTPANIFSCLGHEPRIEIVRRLASQGNLSVTELLKEFEGSQPALSRNLREMREAGIVRSEVAGQRRIYSLCEGVEDLVALATALSEKSLPQQGQSK
jgi:DNA-binding transcriptional ArsR family regulator